MTPGRVRVAFLGPEGTFTEEALLASPNADQLEPVPEPTVYECVMAVHAREVDQAIVPIENSLEGSVNATLDALVFETEEVTIIGEKIPDRAARTGRELMDGLRALQKKLPVITHVRGQGLLIGVELTRPAAALLATPPSPPPSCSAGC